MKMLLILTLLFSVLIAHAQKQDTISVFIIVVDTENNKNMKRMRNNTFTIKGNLIGEKLYDKCLRPLPKGWAPLYVRPIEERMRCNQIAGK